MYEISSEKINLINEYLSLILEANKITNLTSIRDYDKAKILHIEDSLTVLPELFSAPKGLYGDLGTGGGFPGVPLSIISERETILIDSVKKKITIINEILEKLNIYNNISTNSNRIEDIAKTHKEKFSVLSARALSSLPSLLELSSPLLKNNGILICLKANVENNEITHCSTIAKKLAMYLISSRELVLSDNETYRTILVFQKKGKPLINLPRNIGLAQKNPF